MKKMILEVRMVVFYGIFGAIFGSFCALLASRLPQNLPVCFTRSRCLSCQKTLKTRHLIPLFSYAFLRGKCAFCGSKIGFETFASEAFGLLNGVACYLLKSNLVLTNLANFAPSVEVATAVYLLILIICIQLIFTLCLLDLRFNAVSSSLLLALFFLAALLNPANLPTSLAFIGGAAVLKMSLSSYLSRKKEESVEAMGEADVVFFGVIALFFDALQSFCVIFIASLLQLVLHLILAKFSKKTILPFIPALSLAMLLAAFLPQDLFNKAIYGY